jgi:hypothetical protein
MPGERPQFGDHSALQLKEVSAGYSLASDRAAYTNCHPLHFQALGEHADDIMIARARSWRSLFDQGRRLLRSVST